MSRKVILYIATSIDGYIARSNGEVDWLEGDGSEPNADDGYETFYNTIDTVIMGNTTYKQIMSWGEYPYKGTKGYVYTKSKQDHNEDVIFTSQDPKELIRKLKQEEGKDIWVIGGTEIVDLFVKADLIDEYIITIAPVILGEGISLFKGDNSEIRLVLKEMRAFNGFTQNHYVRK